MKEIVPVHSACTASHVSHREAAASSAEGLLHSRMSGHSHIKISISWTRHFKVFLNIGTSARWYPWNQSYLCNTLNVKKNNNKFN